MADGPRFLIVEGNGRAACERMNKGGAESGGRIYAKALRYVAPDGRAEFIRPADNECLPAGIGLADFDGVIFGGSSFHVYDASPEVTAQVGLAKEVLAQGLPFLGSCWGLQVVAVAAGGGVAKSRHGREVGIGRNIRLTEAGRAHPMFDGKPDVFDVIAIHYDEVTRLPPGSVVLATNGHSAVQAAEIRVGPGVFWGLQYHPEFDLKQIARIIGMIAGDMVAQGFSADRDELQAYCADIEALDDDPHIGHLRWRLGVTDAVAEPALRYKEIGNWVDRVVRPFMARRRQAGAAKKPEKQSQK